MSLKIACLSALEKESALFYEFPGEPPSREQGILWAKRSLGNVELTIATSGMGKINAAAAAQFLLDHTQADALIFSGIAGGLNPELGMGDVVVGARLLCLDADMQIIAESAPYLTEFASDDNLVLLAAQSLEARGFTRVNPIADVNFEGAPYGTLASHAPRYTIGAIATSDLFSTEPEVLNEVRTHTFADCEEMEGVAAAQVCARANIPFLAIRSLSNVCGEAYNELDNREQDLITTARLSAEVAKDVIELLAQRHA